MQKLWIAGIGWDAELSESLRTEWINFANDLKMIEKIRIPRWIGSHYESITELHGFCDSSENAYAAAIYARIINPNNEISTFLLISKTRIAPVKSISLPRLELCGAVLLSRLIKGLRESMRPYHRIHLWTDSTIVLSWLNSSPNRWKAFVANRVTEILENVGNSIWRHVSSQDNPADLASRGSLASNVIEHSLWWNGPCWLKEMEDKWPTAERIDMSETALVEQKKLKVFIGTTTIDEEIIQRFSSAKRAFRVIAYIKRFINASRKAKLFKYLD